MPSNYTGSPTATESPAGAPAAGGAPILALPVNGDPDDGPSVAQPFKTLADYIAFLQSPFANLGARDQDILSFRDANLNRRWGIDHWGMPRAAQLDWIQSWAPAARFAGSSVTDPNWSGSFVGSGSQLVSIAPGITYPVPPLPVTVTGTSPKQYRSLGIMIDGGAGANQSSVNLSPDSATTCFSDDTLAVMSVWVQPQSVLSTVWQVGFGTAEAINAFQNAVFFRPTPGLGAGTKWQTCTMVGGVATAADTAISYNTTGHWFRIVWVGKNLDDGQVAARALFYIDGTNMGSVTTNLPNNVGKPILPTIGGYTTGAIATPVLIVGPIRYSQITAIATP